VNICVANHSSASAGDYINAINSEVLSCSFHPIMTYTLYPDAQNIVIEGFTDDIIETIKSNFHKNDPRLILIATEVLKDGILDSASPEAGEEQSGWYDRNSDYWIERSRLFFEVIEYFGFILCPAEAIYDSLAPLNLPNKLVYWRLRYYQNPKNIVNLWQHNQQSTPKTHTILFTGTTTTYRAEQLDSIKNKGLTVLHSLAQTAEVVRMSFARQAYLSIGIKHYKSTSLLSKMRVLWFLQHSFPFVVEKCSMKTDMDEYCLFYESLDDLSDYITDIKATNQKCLENNLKFAKDTGVLLSSFSECLEYSKKN